MWQPATSSHTTVNGKASCCSDSRGCITVNLEELATIMTVSNTMESNRHQDCLAIAVCLCLDRIALDGRPQIELHDGTSKDGDVSYPQWERWQLRLP